MSMNNKETVIKGSGNGPIDSFINGLCNKVGVEIKVADYHQSAISSGSDAKAAAYIELEKDNKTFWGLEFIQIPQGLLLMQLLLD